MFVASGVTSMHSEKKMVEPISTGRRPNLSAVMLKTSEPTSMPSKPAPNTGPRLALLTCQSAMMAGAT